MAESPRPDQPMRSRCTRCDGTGMRVELRVVWKEARTGRPPVRCSRRVADSEQAAETMVELRAGGALDVECVTAAEPCTCRAAPPKVDPSSVRTEEPSRDKKSRSRELDQKSRAAGESESSELWWLKD